MKTTLILVVLSIACNKLFSQPFIVGDSERISFSELSANKKISSQYDLNFSITIANITNKPIRVYKDLWYNRKPSPFANYDCILFRKEDTGYMFVDHYSYETMYPYLSDSLRQIYNETTADSIIRFFDFYKDTLNVGGTDTFQFNLLTNNVYLDSGEYKLQIAFRIGNEYAIDKNGQSIRLINYVYSNWYFFKIEKMLKVPMKKPTID